MTCLVMGGLRAALPTPTRPSSVTISTMSQPWNVNVPMEASGRASRSIGLVQKCGGRGVVLPRQRATRVRTSLIFTLSHLPLLDAGRPLRRQGDFEAEGRGRDGRERDLVVGVLLGAVRTPRLHRLPFLAVLVEDAPGGGQAAFAAAGVVEPVHLDLRDRRGRGELVGHP